MLNAALCCTPPYFQVIVRAPATCTDNTIALQVFDIEHPTIPGQTANPRPYCAQHFNKLGQPWGFKSLPIPGHRSGYPVWLDINLSHAEMRRWVALLDDGLFFDPATVAVTAEVLTYNAHTNLFAKATLLFQSDSGGAFQTYSNVNTLKVRGLTALPLLLLLRDCVDGSSSIAGRSACWCDWRASRRLVRLCLTPPAREKLHRIHAQQSLCLSCTLNLGPLSSLITLLANTLEELGHTSSRPTALKRETGELVCSSMRVQSLHHSPGTPLRKVFVHLPRSQVHPYHQPPPQFA